MKVSTETLKLLGLYEAWEKADAALRSKIENKALRQLWATPEAFVRGLEAIGQFKFTVDLCATAETTKAPIWFGPGSPLCEDIFARLPEEGMSPSDLFEQRDIVWCNPDYLRKDQWTALVQDCDAPTILNVPMSPDMDYSARLHEDPRSHLTLLTGRIQYEPPEGIEPSTSKVPTVLWAVNFDLPALPPVLKVKDVMAIGKALMAGEIAA